MTKRDKLIIAGGATLAIIIISYINRKAIMKSTKIVKNFISNLRNNALNELSAWKDGAVKETDKSIAERLAKYWKEGAGITNWSLQKMQNEAWSAAFISYIVKLSGGGKGFRYAPSHSTYIMDSIKNKIQNNTNPFKGYKPEEVKLEVGDIVAKPRQNGVSYNSRTAYKSHADVVVDIKNGVADTIGGNVNNSVAITKIPLTSEGKIDNAKVPGYKYFVVIKTNS
jgi:hypothetical protein